MARKVILAAISVALAHLAVCNCSSKTGPDERPAKSSTRAEASDDDLVLAIVQTNDVHGYILPRRLFSYLDADRKSPEGYPVEVGGAEWFKGYLDILSERYPERVVLLDAGDMFQGTMISNRFEGATVVSAMERLGYAAAAVGNHEFDFGADGEDIEGKDPLGAIKARGRQADFPLLAANLVSRETGEPVTWEGFSPYTIIERGGVRVGIIGATTVTTPAISKPHVGDHLEFRPLAETLEKYAPVVRREGADIVIGLLHAGGMCEDWKNPDDQSTCDTHEEMWETANALKPGTVDLLIGGHTHSVLFHRVNGIPVMESGGMGTMFGLALVHYSKSKRQVTGVELQRPIGICHYFFEGEDSCLFLDHIPATQTRPATFLGKEVRPVSFLQGLFAEEQRGVLQEATAPLGVRAVVNLDKLEGMDHPLGMLVTWVLLNKYKRASIGLFNESGLRAPIIAGDVTVEDVFQVLPFDSRPAYLVLTGQQLLDLLRVASSGAHGNPVVRGIRLSIDRKADECIAEDWNKDGVREDWERKLLLKATLEDGSPIKADAEYTIVTTSYLANGGSDFKRVTSKLAPEKVVLLKDEAAIRDTVMNWLRKNPVELGGKGDPYTRGTGGLYIDMKNPDHEPGLTCPVERTGHDVHNM